MRQNVSVETYAVEMSKIKNTARKTEIQNSGWRTDRKLPVFFALASTICFAEHVLKTV